MTNYKRDPNKNNIPFLSIPHLDLKWFEEPLLSFGDGGTHTNPKIGIPLFGPKSLNTPRHKSEVHIGFVGEADTIAKVKRFFTNCSKGLMADDIHNGSLPFPGLSEDQGYRFEVILSEESEEKITNSERDRILRRPNLSDRFNGMLDLIEEKVGILCERDHPLDYIFVTLTEEIYSQFRVAETPDPFSGKGRVKRNFRRALKARLMKYKKPTQIIRESTTGYGDNTRDLQDSATRAWNITTGMYYKIGGLPWGPTGLQGGTCFVGISFFRPLGEPQYIRASIAQAFNEYGDGLVLRGQKFRWDDELDKSPHLPEHLAQQLIDEVLRRYLIELKQPPRRVVIHKSSRFDPSEREGFKQALDGVSEHDLVTVRTSGNFRLFRAGEYPPLRGTLMTVGKNHFLYTTGYIPELGKYPHGHVPSPLMIADHSGDTPEEELLSEILTLTKMNWNTANVDGSFPITLQFARLVGDILKEIPDNQIPDPKYIYYM